MSDGLLLTVARPWGSRAPQPLTYVGARVARQDYNTHTVEGSVHTNINENFFSY